ncbi:hypothetical protein L1994_03830 [Methanomicrobium antiquum]|uniref:Uncharacterized protein n=1 Tax=Methanomicrobium antiquum TaxID=487686 RepID=A0AAF0JNL2_9EURY|nr:hypothetical protein [Methanomicrobium antiquum]MDD3977474.1 hypothetical protein [Methanomicrobium sp.]WFN37526.1 hypothetical protein L1994_03830 [Methanomicrobium antiquum]
MFHFGAEFFIIVLFGLVIIFLLFLLYLMQRRVSQLLDEVDDLNSTMNITCSELSELTKNVEEFKKIKI